MLKEHFERHERFGKSSIVFEFLDNKEKMEKCEQEVNFMRNLLNECEKTFEDWIK